MEIPLTEILTGLGLLTLVMVAFCIIAVIVEDLFNKKEQTTKKMFDQFVGDVGETYIHNIEAILPKYQPDTRQQTMKVQLNTQCVYCGTRLFDKDRRCPACGAAAAVADGEWSGES
jgi:tRNA(Ile2) C34 agmatinyltransferase TiaS